MVAKRSSLALALLLALPSAAFALGLGDIRLLSPLNSPLDAQIDLVDVAPDEVNTVQAQLASPETFARYGLERAAYLTTMQVRIVRTPDGHQVITLKSTDPISEPFVTVLVEVNWARGRLVREYTMLLDPPLYAPGQSALANAPVNAPAAGTSAREGEIPRAAETPPAAPAAASPPPAESPPAAVSAPAAAAPPAPTASAAPQPEATAAGEPASATPPLPLRNPHPLQGRRPRFRARQRAAPTARARTSCVAARRCRTSPPPPPAPTPLPHAVAAGCWRSIRRTRALSTRT
jgi:pilus assembly protein FimV